MADIAKSLSAFKSNFDLRLLIDSKLEVLDDPELINNINREASWT